MRWRVLVLMTVSMILSPAISAQQTRSVGDSLPNLADDRFFEGWSRVMTFEDDAEGLGEYAIAYYGGPGGSRMGIMLVQFDDLPSDEEAIWLRQVAQMEQLLGTFTSVSYDATDSLTPSADCQRFHSATGNDAAMGSAFPAWVGLCQIDPQHFVLIASTGEFQGISDFGLIEMLILQQSFGSPDG